VRKMAKPKLTEKRKERKSKAKAILLKLTNASQNEEDSSPIKKVSIHQECISDVRQTKL
jgi:hypothetical protein